MSGPRHPQTALLPATRHPLGWTGSGGHGQSDWYWLEVKPAQPSRAIWRVLYLRQGGPPQLCALRSNTHRRLPSDRRSLPEIGAPPVKFNQLRDFVAIVETGSMRAAARALGRRSVEMAGDEGPREVID